MSAGYRDRPPGAKRTGRLQNREAAEAAALRENLKKRKAQGRARSDGADDLKEEPNDGNAAVAKDAPKP